MADLFVTREPPRALAGERPRDALIWAAAFAIMLLALLAPALWNGFPFAFPDTGGYIARLFEGTLGMGRSAFYGAFVAATIPFQFWPAAILQAALALWLLLLTLRAHGLGERPGLALAVVALLCLTTSLPWYAGQLMPDILFPAAVLAFQLLAFRLAELRGFERGALVAVIAAAIASHMAASALALGLLVSVVGLRAARLLPRAQIAWPAIAVVAGIVLSLVSNAIIAGRLAFTPGGESFVFGRLVQDGFIARYLDEHCPDAKIRLCRYADALPTTADDWLWRSDSPFRKFGASEQYAHEEQRIIIASVLEHPLAHAIAAVRNTLTQLVTFETEVATDPGSKWHTKWTLEQRAPGTLAAYLHARQQSGSFDVVTGEWIPNLDFTGLNRLQMPVAGLSMLALLGAMLLHRRLQLSPAARALAATVLLSLLINAAVCGTFSNTVDRYQSRLIWLAPLALAIVVLSRRPARDEDAAAAGSGLGSPSLLS